MPIRLWIIVFAAFAGLTWYLLGGTRTSPDAAFKAVENVVPVVSPNAAKFDAELQAVMASVPHVTASGALTSGVVADAAAGDPEWARFPRTKDRLPHSVKANAVAIEAAHLYRNVHLNPTDAYIAPAARHQIAAMIDAMALVIARLEQLEGRAMAEEVEIAISEGICVQAKGETVTWESVPAGVRRQVTERFEQNRATYAALGAMAPEQVKLTRMPAVDTNEFVRKYSGGNVQFVPVRALRATSACRSLKRFLHGDLGLRLLAVFTTLGLTPDQTAAKFAEEITLNS